MKFSGTHIVESCLLVLVVHILLEWVCRAAVMASVERTPETEGEREGGRERERAICRHGPWASTCSVQENSSS